MYLPNIPHDPTSPIDIGKHTEKDRRIIPIKDILSVIMAAKEEERNLVGSYWHTGTRRGEALRWTCVDDINFEEKRVRLGTREAGMYSPDTSVLTRKETTGKGSKGQRLRP